MKEPLLDTDTISFFLKGFSNVVRQMEATFQQLGYLKVSVVTYYEVRNGLLFKDAKKQMNDFQKLMQSCQVLPVTLEIAELAANIYADLRRNNQIIGHTDVLIGATALYHDLKIVTNNQAHFSRIPNLELDNWI